MLLLVFCFFEGREYLFSLSGLWVLPVFFLKYVYEVM